MSDCPGGPGTATRASGVRGGGGCEPSLAPQEVGPEWNPADPGPSDPRPGQLLEKLSRPLAARPGARQWNPIKERSWETWGRRGPGRLAPVRFSGRRGALFLDFDAAALELMAAAYFSWLIVFVFG